MTNNAIIEVGTILISLISALVGYLLIPYLKSKTTTEQQQNIIFWVKVAVNAAEQIYKEKGQGKQKKEYVLEFLKSLGLKVTEEEAEILIEALVLEMNKLKQA